MRPRPAVESWYEYMLSDRDITRALDMGHIKIMPAPSIDAIQPCSVDLRLYSEYRYFRRGRALDMASLVPDHTASAVMEDGRLTLAPGEFVLCCTQEIVKLDRMHAARVEGKSSLGRVGLSVHETAGFIDPGFEGQITLEVKNNNVMPITLVAGMKIAQLAFFRLQSTPLRTYDAIGHYNGQMGPTESRFRLS